MIHDDLFESVDDHTNYTWSIVAEFQDPRKRPSTAVFKVKSLLKHSLPRRFSPPSDDINDIHYDFSLPPLDNQPADDSSFNDVSLALGENIVTTDGNETRDEVTTAPPSSARSTRTSKRIIKPKSRFLNSVAQEDLEFHDFSKKKYTTQTCAFNATHLESPSAPAYYEAFRQDDFRIQDDLNDPIAFFASTDGDTLHYGQAMTADDRENFKEAMDKEFTDHCERQHWDIVSVSDVSKDEKVLECVWAMIRKRNILTKQVYKWKVRLDLHGGQQEFGVNYYDTYSPVVSWFTMRLILIHALIHKWHTRQIDFVMAYPQAKIENTI